MALSVRRFTLILLAALLTLAGFFAFSGGRAQAYSGMPRAYRAYWTWVTSFNQHGEAAIGEGLDLLAHNPDLKPLYLRLALVCPEAQALRCQRGIHDARPEAPGAAAYKRAALALLSDSSAAAGYWALLAQDATLELPLVRLVVEHEAGSMGLPRARAIWMQRVLEDSAQVPASFGLALTDVAEARFDEAGAHLRRALRYAPEQPELYRELGRVYFVTRDEALYETLADGIEAAEAQFDLEGASVMKGNLALALMQGRTDLGEAAKLLRGALAHSRQLALPGRVALNYYRLGQLRLLEIDYDAALAMADSADAFRPDDARALAVQTLVLRGTAEWALFRFSDAQQTLTRAREQARAGEMVLEDIQASASLAQLFFRLGRYGDAQDLGIETLQKAQRYNVVDAAVAMHLVLGDNASASGLLDQAHQHYRSAFEEAQARGMNDRVQEASTRLAQVMLDLKDPAAASDYLDRAMTETKGSARVYEGLGRVYFTHGNYQKALEYYDAGLARVGASASLEASLYVNKAWAYIAQEDLTQARNALTRARTALRISGGNPQAAFFVESATAALLYDAGEYAKALELYRQTQVQAQQFDLPGYQWQSLHGIALSAWHLGDVAQAEEAFRSAVAVIEALRSALDDGMRRSAFIQDKIVVYKNFAAFLGEQGRADEAFHFLERARSRGLADLFTTALGTTDPYDAQNPEVRLAEARRRQQALRAGLDEATEPGDDVPANALRASQLRRELHRADSLYRAAFEGLSGRGSLFTAFATPVRVRDVQQVLRSHEALVLYTLAAGTQELGQGEVKAYVVTRDTARVVALPVAAGELRRSISIFRDQISASNRGPGRGWEPTSRRLYAQLVAPVVAVLPPQVEHLNIVPEAEMHYLPFAALRDGRGHFLVQRYSLSAVPSASIFRLARQRAQETKGRWRRVVALADPNGTLPGTRREVQAIKAIKAIRVDDLVGSRATEENLKLFASQADILHFATHGDFNSRTPWSSALELHGSELSVAEVAQIGLDRPYLVVLSACETALQSGTLSDVPQGDEWVGMNQAFMAAGAPSVMSSLWPISDRASSKLVSQFYNALLDAPGKAKALAQVQRAFIQDGAFSHPYYWAAFTLTGDAL